MLQVGFVSEVRDSAEQVSRRLWVPHCTGHQRRAASWAGWVASQQSLHSHHPENLRRGRGGGWNPGESTPGLGFHPSGFPGVVFDWHGCCCLWSKTASLNLAWGLLTTQRPHLPNKCDVCPHRFLKVYCEEQLK